MDQKLRSVMEHRGSFYSHLHRRALTFHCSELVTQPTLATRELWRASSEQEEIG